MKWYFLILTFALALNSCTETEKPQRPKVKMETKPLITVDKNGRYREWYPGHKQVKITGRKNQDGERVGIWKYFSEDGVELSVTVYSNGLKNGHIVVRHPNGMLHYTGEYLDGEPIGVWEFYDEQGQLIETKDYAQQ